MKWKLLGLATLWLLLYALATWVTRAQGPVPGHGPSPDTSKLQENAVLLRSIQDLRDRVERQVTSLGELRERLDAQSTLITNMRQRLTDLENDQAADVANGQAVADVVSANAVRTWEWITQAEKVFGWLVDSRNTMTEQLKAELDYRDSAIPPSDWMWSRQFAIARHFHGVLQSEHYGICYNRNRARDDNVFTIRSRRQGVN